MPENIKKFKVSKLSRELRSLGSRQQAQVLQRFFKTGAGEYGEGDIFIGVKVPLIRGLVKKYWPIIDLKETLSLLHSEIHEERLLALLILVKKFERGGQNDQVKIYEQYLKNTEYINNWDLVDLTAPNIVGNFLLNQPRDILYRLAISKNKKKKRVSILATYSFIKKGEYQDTFKIAELLLRDEQDLIHKAVGWMLREVGKRISLKIEEDFLKKYYQIMPRTMLRYAIERFPEEKRQFYLSR